MGSEWSHPRVDGNRRSIQLHTELKNEALKDIPEPPDLDGPRDGQATDWPLLELPALGLSEAFGNGQELPAAEVLLGVYR